MSEKEHKTLEKIKAELTKILLGSNLYIFTDFDKENKVVVKIKGGVDNGSIVAIDFNKISNFNSIKSIIFEDIDFMLDSTELRTLFLVFSMEYQNDNTGDIFSLTSKIITIDMEMGFNSCKFGGILSDVNSLGKNVIKYINFVGMIHFFECVFEDNLKFENIEFSALVFNSCYIKSSIHFGNIIFNQTPFFYFLYSDLELMFNSVIFNSSFNFAECGFGKIKKVSFISSVFKNKVMFGGINENISTFIQYECKLVLKKSLFEASVFFGNVKFKGGNTIASLEFKSDVVFTSQFLDNNNDGRLIFNNFIIHKRYDFNYIYDIHKRELNIFETHFKSDVIFPKPKDGYILKCVNILKCIFDGMVDFTICDFKEDVKIIQCIFNKDLSFAKSKFLKHIKFMPINTHLSKIINIAKFFNIKRKHFDFIENKVKDNIDFSNVSFEISPNFQSSVFEKLVILYKTKFKEIPNFYSASFSSSAVLDMLLVDIKDYSFNHLKNEIKNKNDLIDIKGVRECLNIFKNALLKTNNILEASKYKVLELYAKELELDYKLEHKKELEEKITIKERFDRWFLKLNRTTSDHHTDFLKILLFTLSVIGGYFMINFSLSSEIVASNFDYLVGKAQPIENYIKMVFNSFDLKNFAFSTLYVLCFIVYITLVLTFSKFKKLLGILGVIGIIGILCSPSIITPFLGAFSEDARNHYLYKAIDDLDDKKALELARIILPNDKDLKEFEPSKTILSKNAKLEQISIFDKTDLSVNFIYEQSNQNKNEQSVYKAKKTLKDYKDELKSSKLLDESPELKRAIAIDGGVSRLNIAYYLVLAFCIFALQKTMRKNSIIPS